MVDGMNQDPFAAAELCFEPEQHRLVLKVQAKRAIRLTEIQGFRSDLETFGASMPGGFSAMQFGEGADIPPEMRLDIEAMNRSNFRWACEVSLQPGATHEFVIPAHGTGKDRAVFTLGYEYSGFLGLRRKKVGLYVSMRDHPWA